MPLDNQQQIVIEDGDEIDLRQYLHVLSKYKWSILGLAFVITLLTTLVVFSIEPTFRATATVLIETQEQKVVSIEEVYGLPGANDEYFETQNQILQSRELAERVIDKLNISQHAEFDPAVEKSGFSLAPRKWIPESWRGEEKPPTTHELRNQIVGQFSEQLSVNPVRNSQLITISFDAHDAELSAAVPNALAQAYIESNLESRLAMTQQAAGWITERLDGLRIKVEESERALQEFRDREKLVDVKGVDSLAAKELDEITAGLVEVRRNLTEAEELYRQVRALEGQPVSVFASIPSVLEDKNVQQAKEVEAEARRRVSELGKRYGPKHPKMIAAVAEMGTASANLNREISNVVNSVEKRYRIAQAKERELNRALNASKGEMAQINRKEHSLRALEREVQTNRQLYDMFLTRFKETNAAGDLQPDNARLVDPAVVPTRPAEPKKLLIVLIALFLGLSGGTVLAFLIEALDNTLKESVDVEHKLQLPVLGIIPILSELKNNEVTGLNYYSDHKETGFSENIRTIRTSVLLTGIDEKKKSILVTSSVPNEGKSVVAVNLALALSQMGKTLLIDADMRRPSVAKIFSMQKDMAGLSHFIAGSAAMEKCVHFFEKDDLHVMPAGVIPPNPLELLSSEKFKKAIEALKGAFDYVVIDSAPTIAVSDSLVMSNYVRSVIYVVKADDTPYQLAADGIKRLRQVDAPIIGAVLNQVAPSRKPGRYGVTPRDN